MNGNSGNNNNQNAASGAAHWVQQQAAQQQALNQQQAFIQQQSYQYQYQNQLAQVQTHQPNYYSYYSPPYLQWSLAKIDTLKHTGLFSVLIRYVLYDNGIPAEKHKELELKCEANLVEEIRKNPNTYYEEALMVKCFKSFVPTLKFNNDIKELIND